MSEKELEKDRTNVKEKIEKINEAQNNAQK